MRTFLCLLSATVAIAALNSCSSEDVTSEPNNQAADEVPVAFSSYLGQSTRTRADITDSELKTNGFGVFAYYTNTNQYETNRNSATPNFMYNTQVSDANGTGWSYSPVRYWPNENIDENGNVTPQYVSFFAYAPYQSAASATGITSLPTNSTVGDPIVGYTSEGAVDLLWGTAGNSGASAYSGQSNSGKALSPAGSQTTPAANATKVNADMTKQSITGKVNFLFKHATAKFGGFAANDAQTATKSGITIDLVPDAIAAADAQSISTDTKVTVKSIKIKVLTAPASADASATALKTSGKFNLATGEWTLDAPSTDAADITEEFNTTAGTGATVNNTLNSTIAEPASIATFDDIPEGVTTTAKNIYDNDTEGSLLLLPSQTPRFVVTIDYVVRTKDATLAKGYTEVEQTITKNVDFTTAIEPNKKYNLAIHLGLTSVKFDATVDTWADANSSASGSSSSEETQSIDMPVNVEDATSTSAE